MAIDTYPTVIFPCSVNSVPFYPATSDRRAVDAYPNFGHAKYLDTLLSFQTKLPYLNKRLFNDSITLQFKTQLNSAVTYNIPYPFSTSFTYTNLAQLHVCSAVVGSDGYPCPGAIVTAFESELNPTASGGSYPITNGSNFWGIQAAPYDNYTDPITGNVTPLASYMWQFTFGDVLSATTGSGIYYLRFDNIDVAGVTTSWYSEPIFVYGADAKYYFPTTLEFEAYNNINKSDILINGWFNNKSKAVIFTNRLEGDILGFEPKGVFLGYLQQNWQAANTYMNSWDIYQLSIGTQATGVPVTNFQQIAKLIEMDNVLINNKYFTYDIPDGGNASPSAIWKMEKVRAKGMVRGSLPIRDKFVQEFYSGSTLNTSLARIYQAEYESAYK